MTLGSALATGLGSYVSVIVAAQVVAYFLRKAAASDF